LKKAAKKKKDDAEAAAKLKYTNAKGSRATLKTTYEDAYTEQVLFRLGAEATKLEPTELARLDTAYKAAKKAFDDN
jgi:hypothetical protein